LGFQLSWIQHQNNGGGQSLALLFGLMSLPLCLPDLSLVCRRVAGAWLVAYWGLLSLRRLHALLIK
jgi:hypothetical protein